MTNEPEEETFSVGLRLGGAEVIGFHINAKSSRIKRWAFFGLITMVVMLLFAQQMGPQLAAYVR